MTVQFENIPVAMKSLPRWFMWRYEIPKGEGKPTKVPYQTDGIRKAISNVPQTWTTFADARAAFARGGFDGIGFALGDGWAGIDLDRALDATGNILPWATDIISQLVTLNTYMEVSPSGTGLHIYVNGTLPSNSKHNVKFGAGAIETYSSGRYFTVTGRAFTSARDIATVADFSAVLPPEMFKDDLPPAPDAAASSPDAADSPAFPDEEIFRLACSAANAQQFVDLWNNTSKINPSEGDFRLCCRLAFWTDCNAQQIDRLFRRSERIRPKWDSARGDSTYGGQTISRAIEITSEVYTPSLDTLIELVDKAGE